MIRFSAALVAVAIGVLIGGIATSELVLVYIAIVVSAVALAVLAIGVMLKRDELLGEGQPIAPAGPGNGPVLSAQSTAFSGSPASASTAAPSDSVFPGRTAFGGTAFGSTAFGSFGSTMPQNHDEPGHAGVKHPAATPPLPVREPVAPTAGANYGEPVRTETARTEAARADIAARAEAAKAKQSAWTTFPSAGRSSTAGPPPSSAAQAPVNPGRSADQPRPWEASTTRASWASAPDARADWTRASSAAQAASAQPASAQPASAQPASAQAEVPASAAPASETQATPSSWFDRLAKPENSVWSVPSAPSPAPSSGAPSSGSLPSGSLVSPGPAPSLAGPGADEDDDEPARYSWLDGIDDASDADSTDDADGAVEPLLGEPTLAAPTQTTERTSAAPLTEHATRVDNTQANNDEFGRTTSLTGPDDTVLPGQATTLPGQATTQLAPSDPDDTPAASATRIVSPELTAAPAPAHAPDSAPARKSADNVESATTPAAASAAEAADASTTPAAADPESAPDRETTEVAVVRGVPRYHVPDCILILFMSEADTQRMPIPQARQAGCTPCTACQPPE